MKTLRLLFTCGVLIGIASCSNPRENHDDKDASDSLYIDSIANDSATWGDTINATDTAMTTDSLASPSFP